MAIGSRVREGYIGTAFQAGGRYRIPLLSDHLLLRGGVSVGFATTKFNRVEVVNFEDIVQEDLKKSGLAAGISLELLARLDGLVAGISGDYTIAPSIDIPANTRLGIAATTMKLSSASVGIVLGVEF
ncbi:MAG: hypothetical protein H7X80_11625 [bacterium]|nr:hypothetical protein [Candidatus Kapabacteria bacterium]